ncbi:carbohydrate esterase family 3 protein [Xylariomycetidae sp. FL2044]|nr:carbohydrate esterase family 3 protein [Xylariomycetidae sp. FL2044]
MAGLSLSMAISVMFIALGATHTFNRGGGGGHESRQDARNDTISSGGRAWKPDNSSSIEAGAPLRIMCLGASIARGEESSDSNGFRQTLRADLAAAGATVNMVGSQRRGAMLDNDEEAYGGERIDQTYERARAIAPALQPNLFDRDVDRAGADMERLIDYLLEAAPRATVVFSTCLTNTVPDAEPRILRINAQYRELVKKYHDDDDDDSGKQKPVILTELHPSEGLPGRPQVEDIGTDGTHPTDYGYGLVGHLFADSILEADRRGYLRWPLANGLADDGDEGRADETVTTTELPPSATTTPTATAAARR